MLYEKHQTLSITRFSGVAVLMLLSSSFCFSPSSLLSCVLCVYALIPVCFSLRLAHIFSNGVVLQRAPSSAVVWGWAAPLSPVSLTLDNLPSLNAYSDPSTGSFLFHLPPQIATLSKHTLTVQGDGTQVVISDVSFGDVLLCVGQSNMGLPMSYIYNSSAEVADSIHYPYLHVTTVPENISYTPQTDTYKDIVWSVSSPSAILTYSAVCYLTGRDLYSRLGGQVPIGLIVSQWGGTRIEAWSSNDTNALCGWVNPHGGTGEQNNATVLYNAMINPIVPYTLTALIWYQGEQNSDNATNYACRFPSLIQQWRLLFQQTNLPFHFALLGPIINHPPTWFPTLRQAQLLALSLPNTAVAVTTDLGDVNSPAGSVHYRDKQPVGNRFMLTLWKWVYGHTDTVAEGPKHHDIIWPSRTHSTATIGGTNSAMTTITVLVRYDLSVSNNAGLHLVDTENCTACCDSIQGSAFKLRMSDQSLLNTTVNVYSGTGIISVAVSVPSTPVLNVIAIEFNNEDFPQCSVKNNAQLPAYPFIANAQMVQLQTVSLEW